MLSSRVARDPAVRAQARRNPALGLPVGPALPRGFEAPAVQGVLGATGLRRGPPAVLGASGRRPFVLPASGRPANLQARASQARNEATVSRVDQGPP